MENTELKVNMNRDFKGIWIPREIWEAEGLGYAEKILWAEINSLHNREKGGCYASNEYLCHFMGIKERRLQEIIANLKSYGLLIQVSFDGRERIIKAIVPPEGFVVRRAEVQKSAGVGCRKVHLSDAENRTPPIYIENKGYRKEENTPYSPSKNSKPKKAKPEAVASDVCVSDSSKELVEKALALMKQEKPTCKLPDKLGDWHESAQLMLNRGITIEQILKVFLWMLRDNTQTGDWKGWSVPLWKSKNKLKYLEERFDAIQQASNAKIKRKFAPSSDDNAALEAMEEMDRRAVCS